MNNKVYIGIAFAIGAVSGSLASWFLLKKKYELIAQKEIDSVKEVYSRYMGEKKDEKDETETQEKTDEEKPSEQEMAVREVEEEITRLGYRDYSDITRPKSKKEVRKMSGYKPSVITPEEFGDVDGYDTLTLTYYADGVLTDDADYPVEDIDDMVGYESLNHFGEYEDDAVYVRNDALRTDYEILYDPRNYSDVMGVTSGQSED